MPENETKATKGGFFTNIQDPKSRTNKSVLAFGKALSKSTEDEYSDEAIATRTLGAGMEGFAATGNPYAAATLAAISLYSSIRGRKKKRAAERKRRRQQIQQISDVLQAKELESRQAGRGQQLRYGSDFVDLGQQIRKGAGQYDVFLGQGVSSISSDRQKRAYRTSAQAAVGETFEDIEQNIKRYTRRSDYLAKHRKKLRGSDDLEYARSAIAGYSNLLEDELAY